MVKNMADDKDLKTEFELKQAINKEDTANKEVLRQRLDIVQQLIKLQEQDAASAKARAAEIDLLLKYEKDINEQKKLKLQKAEAELELAKQELRILETKGEWNEKDKKDKEEAFKKAKEEYDLQKKTVDLTEKKSQLLKNIKDSALAGINSLYGDIVGLAKEFFNETLNTQLALSKFGKPDLLQNYDATNKSFTQFGIGLKEASEAAIALDGNFSQFQNQSAQTQNDLILMAGKLNNLGISLDETGKNFNKFSRGFGMSVEGSKKALESIALTATKAGISPQKAFADLSANIDRLSGSGAKSAKIFEELMKKSKELGVEVGSMLDIVGTSFDTFEGAADKAGKLNAILGGDFLNSVEMLNATEEQRIDLLRQSFQQSGKNFEDLDRFTKKSIIATMGFKNEAEARMMLGRVSTEERLRMKSDQEAQEQLQKAQQGSVETTRLITLAFYNLMEQVRPAALYFRNLIEEMAKGRGVLGFIANHIQAITIALVAFKVGLGIANVVATFRTALGGVETTSKGAADGIEKMGEGIGKGGQKAAPAIPVMLAFGGAIALIGVGVGAAALGLSYLADSFAKLKPEQINGFVTALGYLTVGFVAFVGALALAATFAPAAAATVGILLALGGAVTLIGAGIAIAAAGLGYMAGKFADLFKEMTAEKVGLLYKVAGGFVAIGSAMTFNLFGLNRFAELMKDVVAGINEIPKDEAFNAKVNVIKTVGETLQTAKMVSPEQIRPAKEFIASAKEYYQAQKDSKSQDQDALVQALKQFMKPEKGSTETTSQAVTINIKLDDGSILTGKGKIGPRSI